LTATRSSLLHLRTHYFAMYGVFGAVSPYLPVYLRDVKGLEPAQLGTIFAVGQTGVLFMPALMTMLADRFRVVSPLLIGLFACNLVAMGSLGVAHGFAACLMALFLNQLANQPQTALGDGLFFTLQSDPTQPRASFSSVRIWGTLGFIAASAMVFVVSTFGGLHAMPWVAGGAALLGLLNGRSLPRRLAPHRETSGPLPTVEAARLFRRPRIALFCVGIGLLVISNTAYYGFYPLYLTQQVGFEARWVGLIANIGVGFEIVYMLSFERLRARFGLPGMILLGGAACVARQAFLAFLPSPFFATIFQGFHGLTVIGVLIAPALYLNGLAGDRFRNSVQGLYAMLVVGGFAIVGNLLSGYLATIGLLVLYRVGFAVALCGLVLAAIALRWDSKKPVLGVPGDLV